jgi:NADH-quinone oxidoreductase subunit D
LEHIACVDLRKSDGVLRVAYQFNRFAQAERHVLHVDLAPGETVPSIAAIYGGANWLEREVYDMHGVLFDGHPDLRRLLLPEDATYFPLLKDFDAETVELAPKSAPDEPSPVGETEDRDNYYLNMGPQHPSMHGVLRIKLHMSGEEILDADTIIGYAHRAHEKMAENRDYMQFLPNPSRVDYLSGMIYNLAYCEAVERMLGIKAPERCEYIRVLVSELNRISSHLLWLGTFLLDLGGVTPFLYCFDDREKILDILDRVTGSRLTYCYGRFGGLTMDVDDEFVAGTRAFCERLRSRLPMYKSLVEDNIIFRERAVGIGVINQRFALTHGVTGPCLRAAGVAYDVRRAEPYSIYDRFEFEIPTASAGDCLARYHVRLMEIEQSLRIIDQGLAQLPAGPIEAEKVPKTIKPPAGEYYFAVESARGHFGMYIVSDGSAIPVRIKLRTPSFANLSTMPEILAGTMVADTIAIVGSIDIVLPEVDR